MQFNIIHGDCFKIIPNLDLSNINLVLMDPPYGISFVEKSNEMQRLGYAPIINDDVALDLTPFLSIGKNQIIFGGNFFHLPISRGWIVWDKQHGKKVDYGDCELIWTSFDKPTRIITHVWDGFVRDSDKGIKRVHPSQKPIGLIKKLILDHSSPGDTIFDPFMGSGTTGAACMQLNRHFVGIEIDLDYCQYAEHRIKIASQQLTMFEEIK
jgi:site-specific DNA-methyltransferase (adenine-specific)